MTRNGTIIFDALQLIVVNISSVNEMFTFFSKNINELIDALVCHFFVEH